MATPEYDVALSFAGEDRLCAHTLAAALKQRGVRVFYDKDEQATLWGKDLYAYLSDLYENRAHFCIMFLSEHYARKNWTNQERKAAQARAFQENREYILPLRLDETEIPGILPTTGYLDWHKESVDTIADAAMAKLAAIRDEEAHAATPAPAPQPRAPLAVGIGHPQIRPPLVSASATRGRNAVDMGRLLFFSIESVACAILGWSLVRWLLGQFDAHQATVGWTAPMLGVAGVLWGIAYLLDRATNRDSWEEATSPLFPFAYLIEIVDVHGIGGIIRWFFTAPVLSVASSWALAYGLAKAALSYDHASFSTTFYIAFPILTGIGLIAFVRQHFR